MAQTPNPIGSITADPTLPAVTGSPHPAQIIDSTVPHIRYAVSVTTARGLEVTTLDDTDVLPNPDRVAGTRTVSETMSFLDELSRRPLDPYTSTMWGDYTTGTITAVYNDHTYNSDGEDTAGWRDDLLTLQLVADPDWLAWQKISGAWFAQDDFGDVIEELLHTVINPDQADLYEIIHTIRATSSANFESKIDRSVTSQSLTFTEDVKATAGGKSTNRLEVPKTITLRLRPWEGHPETYDLDAWFRLNVNAGDLRLQVKLKPHQQLLRVAWADTIARITEPAGIPVLAYRNKR